MSTVRSRMDEMQRLRDEDARRIFHPLAPMRDHRQRGPTLFVHGEGIYLEDSEGNRLIDGLSGLWNVCIGHGRREVADAVFEQMQRLEYAPNFFGFSSPPAIELAIKLGELAPEGLTRVFFVNSGSEAVETAFKIARLVHHVEGRPEKVKVIARWHGYHGATLGAVAATGLRRYWELIGPVAPGVSHIPPPYCYRCPWNKAYPSCGLDCAEELEKAILAEDPATVAAFIAEPIQATGGVIIPVEEYLPRVRDICSKYDVFFIADEIVTGFGRTGKMFGVNHSQVVPDMMTLSKGLSSAYLPIGVTLIQEEIYDRITLAAGEEDLVFFHGFTTGGHPTCSTAAVKNIEIILRENLPGRASDLGAYFQERLKELYAFDIVGDVRGLGLIAAVELVKDRTTRETYDSKLGVGRAVVKEAFDRGLICRAVGGLDIIALAPPLVITQEQLNTIVTTLGDAIHAVQERLKETGKPSPEEEG
jgi:putrescine aminotransferase